MIPRIKTIKLLSQNKKGSPILEEILLIGIAIFIFIIVFSVVANMIDWTSNSLKDFFG